MTMTTPAIIPASAEQSPVHTIADILRAMAQDPAIAEAVRQHVLDEELRQLPAAFRQLAATVEEYMVQTNQILAELRAGQARHDQDIAELKAGQGRLEAGQARHDQDIAELKEGQAKLEAGQARLEAGHNELRAKFLPLDARKMVGVIARDLNINRVVWLENTDLLDIATDAGDIADTIPDNELQSFYAVDLALKARGKAERDIQYAVIECSNTVDRNDIRRIRRNAELMTLLTGCPAHPVVIGNLLPEPLIRMAEANGVHCLQAGVRVTRAT